MHDRRNTKDADRRRPDDHLLDEAAEWIGRLRAQDVNSADRQAFSRWLLRSPAHRGAFDKMADLWDGLGVIGSDSVRMPASTGPGRSLPAGRTRRLAVPALALAATLVAAVALFLAFDTDHYATQPGEQRIVRLDDGSTLTLNTATEVEVAISATLREVRLATGGELYVEVAPDRERPFVVRTAHGTARAVGTAFAVHATEERALVSVTQGVVAVRAAAGRDPGPQGPELEVPAGEESVLSTGLAPEGHHPVPVERLSWREGRLVYDDVPLAELVGDLNRYLPSRMTISNPQLGATRVSAVLRITDQTTMLHALSELLPMKWVQVSDSLVIIHPA